MPTISAGNTAEIYCPLASSVTFTPGSGGTMKLGFSVVSGSAAIAPQTIGTATSITVSAGATVFAQAVGVDATYTTPAGVDTALQALVSTPGIAAGLRGLGISGAHMMSAQQFTAIAANTSMLLQAPALRPYVGFRAVYANYGAGQTLNAAKFAHVPTDLNTGAAVTHTALTFAGSTSLVQGAGSGATVNEVPFIDVSDWVYEAGVARSDFVGARQLLQVRSLYSGASSQTLVHSTALSQFYDTDGEEWACNMALTSDRVTSPAAWTPVRTGTTICPVGIEFAYGVPTYTIAEVGDSLRRGQETSSANTGWRSVAHRVARRLNGSSTTGPIYIPSSFAITGQGHAATIATGKEVASKLRPRYLCFRASTPNDGAPTQLIMDASWARTVDLVEHCRRLGVIPVLCTTPPKNGNTAGEDLLLKAQNARILALAGYVAVSDEASAIEDPANRSQILAAYSGGDGTHINSAGYDAMAAITAAVVAG